MFPHERHSDSPLSLALHTSTPERQWQRALVHGLRKPESESRVDIVECTDDFPSYSSMHQLEPRTRSSQRNSLCETVEVSVNLRGSSVEVSITRPPMRALHSGIAT
jgi:hypothetical protein